MIVEQRQFLDHVSDIVEQEVRDDGQHRLTPHEAAERGADRSAATQVLEAAFVLIGVHAMHDVALAQARPQRGEVLESAIERDEPERILEEHRRHADRRDRARHGRRNRHAADAAAGRRREVGDRHDRRRALLLELADRRAAKNCSAKTAPSRCDENLSPGCHSRSPWKSNPEPCDRLR